jgi:hypothetical protein
MVRATRGHPACFRRARRGSLAGMTTLTTIDRPCHRCGHDRVVRLGWSNDVFCFNCRRAASGSTRADDALPAGTVLRRIYKRSVGRH